MSKPSPEQQRITELERALEVAMYWLLRAHGSFRVSSTCAGQIDTIDGIATFLENHGIDPDPRRNNAAYLRGKTLLKRPMEAYHFELEKAVKRATK